MASLYIKSGKANALAERLATERGMTKTAAVTLALENELRGNDRRTTLQKIDDLLKRNPLPKDMGPAPGKAFYDELWDDPD